jgi:hypothetical protein
MDDTTIARTIHVIAVVLSGQSGEEVRDKGLKC